MSWLSIGTACFFIALAVAGAAACTLYVYIRIFYFGHIIRVFQEKPLFIVPRGQPVAGAEEILFCTSDGLRLHGCYFRSAQGTRRGVVLFGLEFGSNCWGCLPYCEHMIANGYDVFTFEPRNSGESDHQPDYEPLQWITTYEVRDFQAAIAYLRGRPDADPNGIGFFGISKGGGAGLVAASRDPYVRAVVTDGIFATHTTMVPYMQKWVRIYSNRRLIRDMLPSWLYRIIGHHVLRVIESRRRCHFPHVENAIRRLSPRPLFMIHGGGDTYIKPEMARSLFNIAREPKEFWLIEGAKHNQAINVAGDDYRSRVLEFFQTHLSPSAEVRSRPALAASSPS
jgi:pimeloyl-ACP methyl ester carboxylesterase